MQFTMRLTRSNRLLAMRNAYSFQDQLMKIRFGLLGSVALFTLTPSAFAQQPGVPGQVGPRGFNNGAGVAAVERFMSMDDNGDGNLTADEVTDVRMRTILSRADANQDGMVSRTELTLMAGGQPGGNRGGGQGVVGGQGFGGDQGFGAGQGIGGGQPGFGGPAAGGMVGGQGRQPGGPGPQPVGQVLPSSMHDQLGLTADQRTAIANLQAEVDAQLARILTPEQQQQLQQLGAGGPGDPPEAGRGRGRGRAQGREQVRERGRPQAPGPDQERDARGPARPAAEQ